MKTTHTFVIYRSHGQYRWKITARNGRKVANGGEAYRNKKDLIAAVRNMFYNWGSLSTQLRELE